MRICKKLRSAPATYWQHKVDMYLDNKQWDLPITEKGAKFLKMRKVRGHLRTPAEGLKKGFTKPNARKHRVNTGGTTNLCAAIIGGRVRVWHYLPDRWCGAEAVALYQDVLKPALDRYRGPKRSYTILEDNDPVGYKCNQSRKKKQALGIKPIEFPTYSPDMNPCDFSLWREVENRMEKRRAPKNETAEEFKARLRQIALGIPERVIRKMLGDMKPRIENIYQNNGGPCDWD